MSGFKIITDTSSDLSEDLRKRFNIATVSFYVSFDSENYYRENVEITTEEFYDKLKETNASTKTSMPSIKDYTDVFTEYAKKGQDIMCICLSKKLSGSYQCAVTSADMVLENYPERKIIVVDSILATASQGLLAIEAAKMRDAGLSLEDAEKKINEIKYTSKIIFTVDSLSYLQKGGRIGKVSAIAGTILNIKPVISLEDGELIPISKVRGRKKALAELTDTIIKAMKNEAESYEFVLLETDCKEETQMLKEILERELGIKINYPSFKIGVTIGAHTGMGTIGIGYIKKFN